MTNSVNWLYRRTRRGLSAVALLILVGACGSDQLNPSADPPASDAAAGDSLATPPADSSPVPTDSIVPPADSTVPTPADSTPAGSPDSTPTVDGTAAALTHSGIVFAAFNMQHKYLTTVHNGSMQGLEPAWLMAELVLARAKGGRMILKMVGGPDDRLKNADGTFSLTKWKALVDRYKTLSFTSYINDGTLMGVFLIDEPHSTRRWGGKIIPHATIEAMAKHTKLLWPGLTTFVRARPTWLVQTPITYVYLDAGWFMYEKYMGDVTAAVTKEVSAANTKRLGLATGLNVLDGGNGSSGVPGTRTNHWKMSATELRTYGTVLLNQTLACGFFNWTHIVGGAEYFARSDIHSAMTFLSNKAKAHVKTSCRQ